MGKLIHIFNSRPRDVPCISFEFFPPKVIDGCEALVRRVQDMGEALQPTFVSLTWRSGFKDESVWLRIGAKIQKLLGIEVLMHLTCHLPRQELKRVLTNARAAGIQNILVLRGEVSHFVEGGTASGSTWRACEDGFRHAIELVHLIRSEHGDFFCIGVAGYPEVHTGCWNSKYLPPSDQSRELDISRLKDKVDAGADFIVTQFCYDIDVFWDFRSRCEKAGINVPIIAGYAPIQNYSSFQKFKSWCHPRVPRHIENRLHQIKDNDEEVQQFGIEIATAQCNALVKGGVVGIHFTTLNLAGSVASILRMMHMRDPGNVTQRDLPWRGLIREREEVRPIFWAHRYSSYLSMTSTWQEFPNGRWGDYRSAATFELGDYYLAEKERPPTMTSRAVWGVPQCANDIANVFVNYMQGRIDRLPWCDQTLAPETSVISQTLCWINQHGFLTINSQPKVNGVDSSDKIHGWGGNGGVCFQKAYVEFFCAPSLWRDLKSAIDSMFPQLSYHAINFAGDEFLDLGVNKAKGSINSPNIKLCKDAKSMLPPKIPVVPGGECYGMTSEKRRGRVNAVTWGVFPGREIIQPTVVDTESFRVWKDEAFELWISQWASIYKTADMTPEDDNAVKTIQEIHDTWFLVNLVDNDYVSETSDIFAVFKQVIFDRMTPEELRQRVNSLESENTRLQMELFKAQNELLLQNRNQR